MIYYIYLITNDINNKKYIGQRSFKGIDISKDSYLGSGTILKQAQDKYGKQHFHKQILEICNSKSQLDEREKYWISYYDATNNDMFYNIASGGTGGNTYAGLSNEQLNQIKEIKRTQTKGKNNPHYGKHLTKEQREQMSKCVKQAYQEHKNTWGKTGYTGAKNKASKTVYCPELDVTICGIREASRQFNIPSPNIIRALKSNGTFSAGKHPITKEKLHWYYVEGEQ